MAKLESGQAQDNTDAEQLETSVAGSPYVRVVKQGKVSVINIEKQSSKSTKKSITTETASKREGDNGATIIKVKGNENSPIDPNKEKRPKTSVTKIVTGMKGVAQKLIGAAGDSKTKEEKINQKRKKSSAVKLVSAMKSMTENIIESAASGPTSIESATSGSTSIIQSQTCIESSSVYIANKWSTGNKIFSE